MNDLIVKGSTRFAMDEIAIPGAETVVSLSFTKESEGHIFQNLQPGVFVDRTTALLMTELCSSWDYSRPERLSALGIQIGVSPLQTWSGYSDTAPTRNFYLFEQEQNSIVYVDDGRDCTDGWTIHEQDRPGKVFFDPKENGDNHVGINTQNLVAADGPPDHLANGDAAFRDVLGELCSRWDYSRPEMLSSKGVFIGVSPLHTWPGCADTAPTRSFFVFGPDVARTAEAPNREFEHPSDRLSDEPSPAAWRLQPSGTPRSAADADAGGSEGAASLAHPGAPPPAGDAEDKERADELTITLRKLQARPEGPKLGPRTCGALEVMREGHLVPEFTALAGAGATQRAATAAPAQPDFQPPPPPAGWGMRLSGGAAAGVGTALVVDGLVPGGAAQRSGLVRRGDVIVRVGGVDVRGWGVREAAALMAGSGDELRLAVRRPQRAFDF